MTSFNYDLTRWDVASGDDMHGMFLGANTLYQTGLFRTAAAPPPAAAPAPVAAATAMLLLSYCHVPAFCCTQIQILLMSCCYHSAASVLMSFCYFHDVDAILLLIFCCYHSICYCHSVFVMLQLPCLSFCCFHTVVIDVMLSCVMLMAFFS